MNTILEQINSAGYAFVEFAGPMLVQSSILIVILLLVDLVLRRKMRAVFRYCIWMLVLVKLVLPTSLSSPMSLGYWFGSQLQSIKISDTAATTEVVGTPQMAKVAPAEVASAAPAAIPMTMDVEPVVAEEVSPAVASVKAAIPVTWQGVMFLAWLAVVIAMGLLLLQRAMFVSGLVAQAKNANNLMNDTFEFCCGQMGIKSKVRLKVSPNATSPAVCGLFRPVILVPQDLGPSLGASHLRAVLMHELAHIKRGDLWVNLVQTVLQIIYFYNPMLWLANAVIRRVREQAVDEAVQVAMGAKAQQYPQTLVNVAKLAFKRPALSLRLIGVVESKSALKGRIKRMLNRPIPRTAKLGILGLLGVIIIAAILLPMAKSTPGPPELVIKGMVKDAQTGKPIAGARVFDDGYGPMPTWDEIRANKRSEWGAITNSAGEYSFLTWPEHHSIRVEAPGYKAKRESLYDGHFTFNKKDEEIFDFALEREGAQERTEFVKTLSNGVAVELVGVCEYPSEGKQWWRPDGELLEEAMGIKIHGKLVCDTEEAFRGKPYVFVVQIDGPADLNIKWGQTDGTRCSAPGKVIDEQGREFEAMQAIQVSIDEQKVDAALRLAVAGGRWQSEAAHSGRGIMSTNLKDGAVMFSEAYESDEGVKITVSDNLDELEHRIAAVDAGGDVLGTVSKPWVGAGKMRQTVAHFKNLSLKQIKKFQFQTRPYEWVEFKNVSLKPGAKTDVEVEVEGTSSHKKSSGFLPNIFIMEPSNTIFSIFEEVVSIAGDYTWHKTGRHHEKKHYDNIFDGAFTRGANDILVLVFSLDREERIAQEYEDLLPRPWPEVEAKLKQGQTVELFGTARDLNVILLAAPKMVQLKEVIADSNFLRNPKIFLGGSGKGSDAGIEDFDIQYNPDRGTYTATVSIRNFGKVAGPKVIVNFYRGDPEQVKPMTHGAGPIKPGGVWNERSLAFGLKEGVNEVAVMLDPANLVEELNETNNRARMRVVVRNGRIVEKSVSYSSEKNAEKTTPSKVPATPGKPERSRADVSARKAEIAAKLANLQNQQARVQRDLNSAERALDEVRRRYGFTDLEERSYPHPVTSRLMYLEQERDNCALEMAQLQANVKNLEKQAGSAGGQKNLKKAWDNLVLLRSKLKALENMREEAVARKRDLDSARVKYKQRAGIRDERKQMLDSIKSQIGKLEILYGEPETSEVKIEVEKAEAQKLSELQLNPAPWVDGELIRMNLNTMVGMEIGTIIYTAESVRAAGKKAWRVESYMAVPLNNMQQFTRVDAEPDSFTPITGRTKNQLGDFKAKYEQDKAQLTVEIAGKETTREIEIDGVAYDNEQAIYLIRRLPLKEGYQAKFPIFSVQGGVVVDSVIEVTGKEKLTVSAGTFDCYKITLAAYSGTVKALEHKLWFSADKHQYLVKYDSGTAIMELAEVALKEKGKPQNISDEELNLSITIPADWHCYKSTSAGKYKFTWQFLSPELRSLALLIGTSLELSDISARQVAEMDVEVLKGFFKNYTVRPDSWREPKINKILAAQYVADYMDKDAQMVEYRTYLLSESMVYWFVFRIEKDKFDSNKDEFDSIVNSFKLRP